MSIHSFRDLLVWQKSVDLAIDCYALTRCFPATERYGLSSQVQRSSVSIPCNIAEGHGKSGPGNFLSHLSHARGSARELETLMIIAGRLDYVPRETGRNLAARLDEVSRMLFGLTAGIERSRAPGRPRSSDR